MVFLGNWNNPIPLSRTWILLEIYCTLTTGSKFEIAMTSSKQDFFIADVTTDYEAASIIKDDTGSSLRDIETGLYGVDKKLTTFVPVIKDLKRAVEGLVSTVDISNSYATLEDDRADILDIVDQTVGETTFNAIIVGGVHDWVINTMRKVMGKETNSLEKLRLKSALANLCIGRGRYSEAEQLLLDTLLERKKRLGEDHPHVHQTLMDLAMVYDVEGKFDDAEGVYKGYVTSLTSSLGKLHPQTVKARHTLADIQLAQGKFEDSIVLFKSIVEAWKKRFGADHPSTLKVK